MEVYLAMDYATHGVEWEYHLLRGFGGQSLGRSWAFVDCHQTIHWKDQTRPSLASRPLRL
jgi:hypothetical protein